MTLLTPRFLGFVLSLLLFSFCTITQAFEGESPWFTGPFIATDGVSTPRGTVKYTFSMETLNGDSFFNDHGDVNKKNSYPFNTINVQPELSYGLTDHIDINWVPGYTSNRFLHVTGYGISDTIVYLGINMLQQTTNSLTPDFRLTIGQLFPSGRFDQLSSVQGLNNVTGLGSYQQAIGFNFAYLSSLPKNLYLNSHLTILLSYNNSLIINGFSAYGGNQFTHGRLKPANLAIIDFADELSLSKQWALGIELYYLYGGSDKFTGYLGEKSDKSGFFPSQNNLESLIQVNNVVGNKHRDFFSVIPSIEFNFNQDFGLLVGYWFMVAGANIPINNGPMLSFSASWA